MPLALLVFWDCTKWSTICLREMRKAERSNFQTVPAEMLGTAAGTSAQSASVYRSAWWSVNCVVCPEGSLVCIIMMLNISLGEVTGGLGLPGRQGSCCMHDVCVGCQKRSVCLAEQGQLANRPGLCAQHYVQPVLGHPNGCDWRLMLCLQPGQSTSDVSWLSRACSRHSKLPSGAFRSGTA